MMLRKEPFPCPNRGKARAPEQPLIKEQLPCWWLLMPRC